MRNRLPLVLLGLSLLQPSVSRSAAAQDIHPTITTAQEKAIADATKKLVEIMATVAGPRWSLVQIPDKKSFSITIDTRGLAANELVTEAKCRLRYLDASSSPLEERDLYLTVPIARGLTRTETFVINNAQVVTVRGVSLAYKIRTAGSFARSGASDLDLQANAGKKGTMPLVELANWAVERSGLAVPAAGIIKQ
jgi:hypothetical protein